MTVLRQVQWKHTYNDGSAVLEHLGCRVPSRAVHLKARRVVPFTLSIVAGVKKAQAPTAILGVVDVCLRSSGGHSRVVGRDGKVT
jgi:hypothetical protein